ncbi:MAG: hypothetical protein WCV84_05650 [Patescibacteria group bacterium]
MTQQNQGQTSDAADEVSITVEGVPSLPPPGPTFGRGPSVVSDFPLKTVTVPNGLDVEALVRQAKEELGLGSQYPNDLCSLFGGKHSPAFNIQPGVYDLRIVDAGYLRSVPTDEVSKLLSPEGFAGSMVCLLQAVLARYLGTSVEIGWKKGEHLFERKTLTTLVVGEEIWEDPHGAGAPCDPVFDASLPYARRLYFVHRAQTLYEKWVIGFRQR